MNLCEMNNWYTKKRSLTFLEQGTFFCIAVVTISLIIDNYRASIIKLFPDRPSIMIIAEDNVERTSCRDCSVRAK